MPRPTTALIVDDEAHTRTYVRLLLKDAGITTTWEAEDGDAALALFAEHKPELVMLDVNLRSTTGLQVLRQLKELADVPVIMISSENAMKTVNEAVRLGAHAYILKHTPKDGALAELNEALDELSDDEPEA